jgi:ribosomal 50S subunit-recycling heat shock protein
MRIDKFLNAINLVKRRAIAEDMLAHKAVLVNGVEVKKSKEVKVGDIITLKFLDSEQKYKILQIPTTKTTPKSKQSLYIQRIEDV